MMENDNGIISINNCGEIVETQIKVSKEAILRLKGLHKKPCHICDHSNFHVNKYLRIFEKNNAYVLLTCLNCGCTNNFLLGALYKAQAIELFGDYINGK